MTYISRARALAEPAGGMAGYTDTVRDGLWGRYRVDIGPAGKLWNELPATTTRRIREVLAEPVLTEDNANRTLLQRRPASVPVARWLVIARGYRDDEGLRMIQNELATRKKELEARATAGNTIRQRLLKRPRAGFGAVELAQQEWPTNAGPDTTRATLRTRYNVDIGPRLLAFGQLPAATQRALRAIEDAAPRDREAIRFDDWLTERIGKARAALTVAEIDSQVTRLRRENAILAAKLSPAQRTHAEQIAATPTMYFQSGSGAGMIDATYNRGLPWALRQRTALQTAARWTPRRPR